MEGDQRGSDLVLEIADLNCAAEDMGDEIMALRLDTGVYFSMRFLTAVVWRDLAAGRGVNALAERLRATTGDDAEFQTFVDQVLEHGLMRRSPLPAAGGALLLDAALEDGQRGISLEIFEDMKDLILSDPIHDVDEESGWPTPRPRP